MSAFADHSSSRVESKQPHSLLVGGCDAVTITQTPLRSQLQEILSVQHLIIEPDGARPFDPRPRPQRRFTRARKLPHTGGATLFIVRRGIISYLERRFDTISVRIVACSIGSRGFRSCLKSSSWAACRVQLGDRKSTRLNSSH